MDRLKSRRVVVRRTLDGLSVQLPNRETGPAGKAGWILVGFGLLVVGFMVLWMWGPLQVAFGSEGAVFWASLVFGLLGLPGLAVGVCMIAFGFALVYDALRSEIRVVRQVLVAIEWIGPLPWKRKRPLEQIERLVVTRARSESSSARTSTWAVDKDLRAIRAEGVRMQPLLLAVGYPGDVLENLVGQLAAAIDAARPTRWTGSGAFERIRVVDAVALESDVDEETVPEQPAGSRIELEWQPKGLSLAIPASGLVKGSKGLFGISLFWLALCLIMFSAVGFGLVDQEEFDLRGALALGGFGLMLIGVGVAMMVGAVHLGRSRAAILVQVDELAIRQVSPVRSRAYQWQAGQLAAIRVGASGMEVNDKPVMELKIFPREGKPVGLLSQLSNGELEWMAALLRKALGVPRYDSSSSRPGHRRAADRAMP